MFIIVDRSSTPVNVTLILCNCKTMDNVYCCGGNYINHNNKFMVFSNSHLKLCWHLYHFWHLIIGIFLAYSFPSLSFPTPPPPSLKYIYLYIYIIWFRVIAICFLLTNSCRYNIIGHSVFNGHQFELLGIRYSEEKAKWKHQINGMLFLWTHKLLCCLLSIPFFCLLFFFFLLIIKFSA